MIRMWAVVCLAVTLFATSVEAPHHCPSDEAVGRPSGVNCDIVTGITALIDMGRRMNAGYWRRALR
jgi:hypothetical protein